MSTNRENDVFVDQECRLVLIGKTGAGKSATGNTILGRSVFRDQVGLNSETKQCGKAAGMRGDLTIIVTDTPGLSDTDDEDKIIMDRITKSMMAARPGPHAILLVLRCDARFTSEEEKVYKALKDILGQNMNDFLIIVFTGKDNTESEKFERQLQKANKLKGLLNENGNRYILFNNKAAGAERDEQVDNLLAMVMEVARKNGRTCFHFRLADQMESTVRKMVLDHVKQLTGQSAGPEADGNTNPDVPQQGSRIEQDLKAIGHYQSVRDRMKMLQQSERTDDQRPPKPASRATLQLPQAQHVSPASLNPAKPTRSAAEEKVFPSRAGEQNRPAKQSSPTPETARRREIEQEDKGQYDAEVPLVDWQLRGRLLAQVMAIMSLAEAQRQQEDEEYYAPYEVGVDPRQYSDMQLLECLMMNRVLNEKEPLSTGQMQLLTETERVVTEEVKEGMRKEEISEVRQLAKCIVM